MEIEVGEYAISKNRVILGKVIEIKNNTEVIIRTLPRNGFSFDMLISIDNVKHSKNIIDLIGEGDYVNGKYVYSVGTAIGNLHIINHTDGTFTPSNMIKSIVTKESFASVEYKI